MKIQQLLETDQFSQFGKDDMNLSRSNLSMLPDGIPKNTKDLRHKQA